MNASPGDTAVSDAYAVHRARLFALCYRMTGSATDADDLVQATFERALERPPRDTLRPWGPWLTRVAVNLCRDHLRRRRRRAYVGPWLPEPIDTDTWLEELARDGEPRVEPADTAGRYDLLESVSFAFLVALEALSPTQRAVLLLRDVLEYSAREAALALEMSEANVRTTHHRARRAMARYDADRSPQPVPDDQSRELIGRFVRHMGARDATAIASLLHEDVLHLADGAGRVSAARVPVRGRPRVARLHAGLGKGSVPPAIAFTRLNGQLALLAEYREGAPKPHLARRYAILAQLSRDGLLRGIYFVANEDKLRAVDFEGAAWLGVPAAAGSQQASARSRWPRRRRCSRLPAPTRAPEERPVNAYDAVQLFAKTLDNLEKWMNKAEAYAKDRSFDVDVLAQARLAPDQYAFAQQVQAACDQAKVAAAYLGGKPAPSHPDTEKTFPELRERIRKCASFLATLGEGDFAGAEERKVAPPWLGGKWLRGGDYLVHMAVPNFFFHATTAYAILRHNGVALGKPDYIGSLPVHEG